MKRLALPLLLAVLALGALVWRTTPEEHTPLVDLRESATYGNLHVQTSSGPLSLADLRGQVVVVYFGYTSCPDICPTTLATMGRAFHALDEAEQAQLALLFVSVDPARDDAERLDAYAGYFHPRFRGGTSDPDAIAAMAADWGVAYRKVASPESAMTYTVDHSTQAFLVGRDGRLIREIAHGTRPDEVARLLRQALVDSAPR